MAGKNIGVIIADQSTVIRIYNIAGTKVIKNKGGPRACTTS